jgi:ubiquitin-conjugating enzyme E2 Z
MPLETDISIVHAVISGPFETPYEGGFFHFVIRFGPNYPFAPPRVRFMTTGGGQVDFNPNLYRDGKVPTARPLFTGVLTVKGTE